jgi:hypothetical protein
MADTWIASTDEERWTCYEEYGTREEAIEHASEELDLEPGQTFYTARKVVQRTDNLVRSGLAGFFAEKLAEDVCEDIDEEFCPDWLNINAEEKKKLAALLSRAFEDFIEQHPRHKPTWFMPENVKEHNAPELAKAEEVPHAQA